MRSRAVHIAQMIPAEPGTRVLVRWSDLAPPDDFDYLPVIGWAAAATLPLCIGHGPQRFDIDARQIDSYEHLIEAVVLDPSDGPVFVEDLHATVTWLYLAPGAPDLTDAELDELRLPTTA